MTYVKSLALGIFLSTLFACVHDQCNNVPQRPEAPVVTPTDLGPTSSRTVQSATKNSSAIIPEGSVQISRPTGEKQCSVGKSDTINQVLAELSNKKIRVYESHTQADGMIHTDLCGAPAGNVNVFTISKKDLNKALKLGFKEVKN